MSSAREIDLSVKPTLTGDRVLLRPVEPADVAAFVRILAEPEVRWLTGSAPGSAPGSTPSGDPSEAGADDQLDPAVLRAWYLSRNDAADRLDLVIVDQATGQAVGEVVLNELDRDNRCMNLRILMGADGRDRGLGTEAVRLMSAYALDVVGLHRVELEVYAFNPRARRAYEKAGFLQEGTRRDALRTHEGWIDAHVMALLATDPREHM